MKPKKMTYSLLKDIGWEYECPKCGFAIGINKNAEDYTQEENFCGNCGTELEWGNGVKPHVETEEKAFNDFSKIAKEFIYKYGTPHSTIIINQSGIEHSDGRMANDFLTT